MAWTKTQADRALKEVIERAQRDAAFRQQCLDNPQLALKQVTSEELPLGFTLRFVENNGADLTVVLPDPIFGNSRELSDDELASVSGGVSSESCFAAGTPVLMADGSSRAIESVTVGDAVLAYDEQRGRVVVDLVATVMRHAAEPLYGSIVEGVEREMFLTSNHPFYSAGRWRSICDLTPRSEIYHFDPVRREATWRRLVSLELTGRREPVYNFEVTHAHTYFVDGLLVHNGGVGSGKSGGTTSGTSGTCFSAGTPVLMADGTARPIEGLTVGDAVLAYDERHGRVVADLVATVMHHAAEPLHRAIVDAVEHEMFLTSNHPFYSAGLWRAIRDLTPQSELYHFDPVQRVAAPRRLLSLEPTGRREPVYNFEVMYAHTYFVDGLLVHNGGIGHK